MGGEAMTVPRCPICGRIMHHERELCLGCDCPKGRSILNYRRKSVQSREKLVGCEQTSLSRPAERVRPRNGQPNHTVPVEDRDG